MKAAIVGAGFGGLSAAALLAKEGFDVEVIEKNEQPGGRASVYSEKGFTFDMGPSWYLMPDVYETFFAAFGKKPEDFYTLKRLDPAYRIFFGDGDPVDIRADLEEDYALFDSFEEDGGEKLRAYLASAKEMYDLSINELLYRDYRSIFDFLNGRLIMQGSRLHIFENLGTFVRRHFESDRAQKIVQYSIGFLGGAPQNTPSFYHIMSHIDMTMGVWYPDGGIRAVAGGIAELARSYGAEISLDEPVRRIEVEGKRATGVVTEKGRHDADLVLVNADYAHAELDLLDAAHRTYPEKYWRSRVLAPSAFVIYLGLDREVPALAHHTLFLDRDWEAGFERIFDPNRAAWPENPSYYVNVPSRTDPTAAPPGSETLFILVPLAPGLEDTPALRERLYTRILDDLEAKIGEELRDAVVVKRIFALNDFAERYNAYRGTALGLSHTLLQTALWRPAHLSRKVGNLYYTGQYTHPGIGVPMTLISSTIVAREIAERHPRG
ncbi:phytoene desaturase family protein [Methanofollis tationis]|uniref:Phytoene desaturase n=1 Tax=Methanofollis tationis TaxID=81417 RepID=A0A7K4HQJ8_9EURY|nr:phytoene desaturase family protein [Methanofollis tationis]NVO67148.1 phytoene desaturase [Methanofollis tationis]